MASALMRRSVLTAALATVATIASPLVGTSMAATTFAATGITSSPAPDATTSPQTVEANRPSITATFNAPLAGASSVTIVKHGDSTNLCTGSAVSGSSVTCTPSSPLALGTTYDAIGHGVAQSDGSTADSSTFSFQVGYPSYSSSVPVPGGSLRIADQNNPVKITWTTTKGLDASKSTITVKDFIDGQPANPVQGATQFAKSAQTRTTNDIIEFLPSSGLSDGAEYQVIVHVEEVGESATNPALADLTFNMWIDTSDPASLAHQDGYANNVNQSHFHLMGIAGSGQSMTLQVTGRLKGSPQNAPKVPLSSSGTVPTCGQPTCAFDIAVDVTNFDDQTLTWTAQSKDGNGNSLSAVVQGPPFIKDTTAPTMPSPAADFSQGPALLHVTAANPDSPDADVDHYLVQITDSAGQVFGPAAFAPDGSDGLDTTIDVSSLADGQLVVFVWAVDHPGNRSADACDSTAPSCPDPIKPTKNVGNSVYYKDSTVTSGGKDLDLDAASSHPIQTVTKVTVFFTQNVDPSWTDTVTSPGKTLTNSSSICLEDRNSDNGTNCQNSDTTFPAPNVMQTTVSHDLFDASGYHVFVTAWPAAFCHNVDALHPKSGNCTALRTSVMNPANGHQFSFTVDDTPPTPPTVHAPGVIDANGIPTVLQGTAEAGSTVVLGMRSSNGGFQAASTTADGNGQWQKVINQWALPDGALTITADAIDAAGNNSSAGGQHGTATSTLAARPSAPTALGVAASGTQATFTWAPPSYTGGTNRIVTDYVVSLTDTTVAATSSIDQAHSPQTLGPLTPGHAYKVSVYGSNGVPCPCNSASTQFVAKYSTALSAFAARVITYGTATTVHGTLTYANGVLVGKPVTVTSRYYNGAVGPTYHATTDQNGNWAVTGIRPPKNITYVASFAGDSLYAPSSRAVGVAVRVAIRITKVSARSSSHLSPVTLSGSVAPNMHGYLVYIYEVRSGKLVKIGSARLSSKSTWSFAHKFTKGKHLVVAKFFGHAGNATNQTGRVKIVRT